MKLYAVVMAGGSGTRFWPLSRRSRPKQFLPIISDKTMVEETVQRLDPLVPPEGIYTIAGEDHSRVMAGLLSEIPPGNFIVEPRGKNTAPSLMLATAVIFRENPEAVIAALPADHLIRAPEVFRSKISAAARAAYQSGRIITFGIPPTSPSTGYGYIRFSRDNVETQDKERFYPVLEFKEKPGLEQAREFLKAGTYFWNSGMFIWRADAFASKLETYAPDMYPFWQEMLEALDNPSSGAMEDIFDRIPGISIDYALMEKARDITMCEGDFGWSDVGAWSSLDGIWDRDSSRISAKGEVLAMESERCTVYNPGKLTALIGVEDLIVVDTEDVLLVCRKDLDQKVKSAVEELKKRARKDLL